MRVGAAIWALALVIPFSSGLRARDDNPQGNQKPAVKIPEPGVPQIMTIEGTWVRAAYNNEGYAIVGYRLANQSIGEPWMLLEFGTTVRDNVPDYVLKRDALSLETPDGTTVPLATVQEHREANLRAMETRERVQRDSINYFPPSAIRACRLGFFSFQRFNRGKRAVSKCRGACKKSFAYQLARIDLGPYRHRQGIGGPEHTQRRRTKKPPVHCAKLCGCPK